MTGPGVAVPNREETFSHPMELTALASFENFRLSPYYKHTIFFRWNASLQSWENRLMSSVITQERKKATDFPIYSNTDFSYIESSCILLI